MGLRVGLTGGLGSGKSTVAAMMAALGANILSADEIARKLMEPGTAVFNAIVATFGPTVIEDNRLNRPELARLAFTEDRVEELNAIIHPATIARQGELTDAIFAENPGAIVVVESALIFETTHADGWRERFDRLVLVTAPETVKIDRFVKRSGSADRPALEAEAKRRLARLLPDEIKGPRCDFVIANDRTLEDLHKQVSAVWQRLLPAS